MSAPLHTVRLDGVSPTEERNVVLALYDAACTGLSAPPTLVISRLTGDSSALGRYQPSADADVFRRLTGGPACAYGDGQVSLCLILPDWPSAGHGVGLDKLINRMVRGTLRGLTGLGMRALYGGRDFIVADGTPVGLVTMEGNGRVCGLFQCVLGWARPVLPATGDDALTRPWTALSSIQPQLSFAQLATALIDGYAHTTSRTPTEVTAPDTRTALPHDMTAQADGLQWCDPITTPVGPLRAGVRMDADGKLAHVTLTGEWLGDSDGIHRLCAQLEGCTPSTDAVAQVVGRIYPKEGHQHALLGLRPQTDIPAAVCAAAMQGGLTP